MYTAVRRTNWGRTNCHAHRLLRARQRSVLLAAVVCLPLLPCSAAPAAPAGPRHGDQGVGGGSSGGVLRGGGRPSGALLLLPMEPGSGAAAAFRTRSGDAQPLASALGTSLSMLLATAIAPFRSEIEGMAAAIETISQRVEQLETAGSGARADLDEIKQTCRSMQHELEESRLASGEAQTSLKMLDDRCAQALGAAQDGSTAVQAQVDAMRKTQQQLLVRMKASEAELAEKASQTAVDSAHRQLGTDTAALRRGIEKQVAAQKSELGNAQAEAAAQLAAQWEDKHAELRAELGRMKSLVESRVAAAETQLSRTVLEEAATAAAERETASVEAFRGHFEKLLAQSTNAQWKKVEAETDRLAQDHATLQHAVDAVTATAHGAEQRGRASEQRLAELAADVDARASELDHDLKIQIEEQSRAALTLEQSMNRAMAQMERRLGAAESGVESIDLRVGDAVDSRLAEIILLLNEQSRHTGGTPGSSRAASPTTSGRAAGPASPSPSSSPTLRPLHAPQAPPGLSAAPPPLPGKTRTGNNEVPLLPSNVDTNTE